jgi:hypothetical protein
MRRVFAVRQRLRRPREEVQQVGGVAGGAGGRVVAFVDQHRVVVLREIGTVCADKIQSVIYICYNLVVVIFVTIFW